MTNTREKKKEIVQQKTPVLNAGINEFFPDKAVIQTGRALSVYGTNALYMQ